MGAKRQATEAEETQVRQMHAEGLKVTAIARRMGIAQSIIARWCMRWGLTTYGHSRDPRVKEAMRASMKRRFGDAP